MQHEILHLKAFFPALAQDGCDPTLTVYLQDNMIGKAERTPRFCGTPLRTAAYRL